MKTHWSVLSVLVLVLIAVSTIARAEDRPPSGFPGNEAEPLGEFLAGTRWYWEGSKSHILEFEKDGKVDLDYWKYPTDWKVSGHNEVIFTMHLPTGDLNATATFTEDRSSFSGTQFRGGIIARSPRAPVEKFTPLAEFLPGTKWFWEGSKQHILEFQGGGRLHLDYWKLPTDWKVTGPNQVTFTMHFKTGTLNATINFDDDRSSFSGTQFRGGTISKSPRAS
ncbi:hypothetical protein CfE428DRAFT_0744 [Chthoniobacter flavus Ellin428]|uniref:Uncharacterized protein n=1 Tax=Chthoniobacter flavus Ellin428 TaxID=497964 RepID=B4CVQ7_9BACT|nr:hypothetical protein CfE428DRAFT_0744 [Chthoniobacter flavus Ellin428]TCO95450.1 hypothetical protein EV701_101137 [Chthoniobacter flavus]